VSNARDAKAEPGKGKGLAAYRKEFGGGEPFRLPLDDEDGTVLEVPRPTTDRMLEAENAINSREAFDALCGDRAEEFLKALGPEDAAVLRAVVEDMQEFFGMGN
jgi:hypothetical protein